MPIKDGRDIADNGIVVGEVDVPTKAEGELVNSEKNKKSNFQRS